MLVYNEACSGTAIFINIYVYSNLTCSLASVFTDLCTFSEANCYWLFASWFKCFYAFFIPLNGLYPTWELILCVPLGLSMWILNLISWPLGTELLFNTVSYLWVWIFWLFCLHCCCHSFNCAPVCMEAWQCLHHFCRCKYNSYNIMLQIGRCGFSWIHSE